jgi:hypothetical protein
MKAVPLEPMESVMLSDNGFTKIFKVRGDIDIFLTKAVDEETDKHFMVASIREIVELQAHGIQFPFQYDTEAERDKDFEKFKEKEARDFVEFSIQFIKDKEEWKKQEAEKIRQNQENGNNSENNLKLVP